MSGDSEPITSVVVWYEGGPQGRSALAEAHALAQLHGAHLTVVTVATQERVIGCGRCLQGTVIWNLEMKKIASEDLLEARRILDGADEVSFEVAVATPVDGLSDVAARAGAQAVVLPWQRSTMLTPPNRRNVAARVAGRGPWRVVVAENPLIPN